MAMPLIIIGASGNAHDIIEIVEAINEIAPTWTIAGFLDDGIAAGSETLGYPVLGAISDAMKFPNHRFINAVGSDNSYLLRRQIIETSGIPREQFATLVHPLASISSAATLGVGVYVSFGCAIGGNVKIADHVAMAPGVVVGHDTVVDLHTMMAPGACVSGYCHIGPDCYIGSRASVRQRVTVGARSLLGMGTVVLNAVHEGCVIVGNPGRVLRSEAISALPRVDVIVPCYKYAHFLKTCVQSVLDQQGVAVRVLIVDDCSPDNTTEIAKALVAADARVTYRRHETNLGHIATFNEGLDWLSGKYGLLLSADDMLTPGALARSVALMEKHPNVVFCYGAAIQTSAPGVGELPPRGADDLVIPGPKFLRQMAEAGENVVPTPTALVRTGIQKRIGGYRHELAHSGDLEMWLRFAAHGDVGYIDAPQAWYRIHGNNMFTLYPGERDYDQRKAAYEEIFTRWSGQIENAGELRSIAMRMLADSAFWTGNHLYEKGDVDGCKKYHALAVRIDPTYARTGSWMKFHVKKIIGPERLRGLRPLVSRLRGGGASNGTSANNGSAAASSDGARANGIEHNGVRHKLNGVANGFSGPSTAPLVAGK